jgi:hypothetical protein
MRFVPFLLIGALLCGCGSSSDDAFDAIRAMYSDRQKLSESEDDYSRRQHEAHVDVPLMTDSTEHEMTLRWATYNSDSEMLSVTIPLGDGVDHHGLITVDQRELDQPWRETRRQYASFVALNLPGPQPAWQASLKMPRLGMPDKLSSVDWRITFVPAVSRDCVALDDSMWAAVVLRSIELRDRKSGSVFWKKTFPAASSRAAS